ncbi:hypothetical protein [Mixta gaviniae]|uniref:hypothetical protein n=1 Tax=Mixta gaviniae TaxID=665914 RepID=UPI001FE44803|nr:hypothetical protein [Mixta gaviniae]
MFDEKSVVAMALLPSSVNCAGSRLFYPGEAAGYAGHPQVVGDHGQHGERP